MTGTWWQALSIALYIVGAIALVVCAQGVWHWWKMGRRLRRLPGGEPVAVCCICHRLLTADEVTEVQKVRAGEIPELEGEPGGSFVVAEYCEAHAPAPDLYP